MVFYLHLTKCKQNIIDSERTASSGQDPPCLSLLLAELQSVTNTAGKHARTEFLQ